MTRLGYLVFVLFLAWISNTQAADTTSLLSAIRSQHHSEVLIQINMLRRAGVNTGVEALFFEGQALFATGQWAAAESALSNYLSQAGRATPRYDNAVMMIARARVALAGATDSQVKYSATGSEGNRVVGKVETVNVDFGYIRIRLDNLDLDPNELYVKPDEFGSVRYRLRTPKKLADGLLSVIPEGDIKQLKVGQPVYRLLAEDK